MGLLGNVNVKVHFGIVVLIGLAGGAAVQIWAPPGALAEYKDYAIWLFGFLGVKRMLDVKNGGK